MEKIYLQLRKAEVLKVKAYPAMYGSALTRYVGIVVKDPFVGKVWFKTTAKFAFDLTVGKLVSATVEVMSKDADITFCKKPKDVIIEDAPIRILSE